MSPQFESTPPDELEQRTFLSRVDDIILQESPNFDQTLNIAIIGKVSAGKSSILNALLRRTRDNALTKVAAKSGATEKTLCFQLDEHVLIIDSPGLDDIERERSDLTKKFLANMDVAVLVLTGSADASQKKTYDELRRRSKRALVVLNKIDEWDDLTPEAVAGVVQQWKEALQISELFPTCAKAYDSQSKPGTSLDLRGIDELLGAIESFLRTEGKELLLARHMGDKTPYAVGIIVAALVAVGAEALLPGAAAFITATQAVAITSLHYLYTGKALSKSSALGLLPTFMGRAIGYNLFLWVKSILPPTGIGRRGRRHRREHYVGHASNREQDPLGGL